MARVTAASSAVQSFASNSKAAILGFTGGLLAVAGVAATVVLATADSMEKSPKRAVDAVTSSANKTFRDIVQGLNEVAKQGGGDSVNIVGNSGRQIEELSSALRTLPADQVVQKSEAMGLGSEELSQRLKETKGALGETKNRLQLLLQAQQAIDNQDWASVANEGRAMETPKFTWGSPIPCMTG